MAEASAPPHIDVDVAIVGGGPAGTAAALTLLRYSNLRVALIERSRYEAWRAGETLGPSVRPLLQYLDAATVLDAHTHLPAYGTAAAWGGPRLVSHDFLFTGRGEGWHLDRVVFDRALATLVASRGGLVLLEATVTGECSTRRGWQLQIHTGPGRDRAACAARVVIDASGRRAVFGRRRGAHRIVHDRLFGAVGLCTLPQDSPQDTFTIVETVPDGWWYAARLPDGRMVAAFMTDADLIRRHRLHASSSWWALVRGTIHVRRQLERATCEGPPAICPAFSQILNPIAGPGWIAAGDAAVGFDPLSSMGIGYALTSGIHAARAAHDVLTADGALVTEYARSVARHFARYQTNRTEYYAMERRWQDAPFWARRVIAPTRVAASTTPRTADRSAGHQTRHPG